MSSANSMPEVASVEPKTNLQSQSTESPVPHPCSHEHTKFLNVTTAPARSGQNHVAVTSTVCQRLPSWVLIPTAPRASHALPTVAITRSTPHPARFSSMFPVRGAEFTASRCCLRPRQEEAAGALGTAGTSLPERAAMPKAWTGTHTHSRAPQGGSRSCKAVVGRALHGCVCPLAYPILTVFFHVQVRLGKQRPLCYSCLQYPAQ